MDLSYLFRGEPVSEANPHVWLTLWWTGGCASLLPGQLLPTLHVCLYVCSVIQYTYWRVVWGRNSKMLSLSPWTRTGCNADTASVCRRICGFSLAPNLIMSSLEQWQHVCLTSCRVGVCTSSLTRQLLLSSHMFLIYALADAGWVKRKKKLPQIKPNAIQYQSDGGVPIFGRTKSYWC